MPKTAGRMMSRQAASAGNWATSGAVELTEREAAQARVHLEKHEREWRQYVAIRERALMTPRESQRRDAALVRLIEKFDARGECMELMRIESEHARRVSELLTPKASRATGSKPRRSRTKRKG